MIRAAQGLRGFGEAEERVRESALGDNREQVVTRYLRLPGITSPEVSPNCAILAVIFSHTTAPWFRPLRAHLELCAKGKCRCSGPIALSPSERIAARSITCCSSRTLPGQE